MARMVGRRRGGLRGKTVLLYLLAALILGSVVRSYLRGDFDAGAAGPQTAGLQALVYDEIYEGIRDHKSTILLSSLADFQSVAAAYAQVLRDHPEFFWPRGGRLSEYSFTAASICSLQLDSVCHMSAVPAMEEQLDRVVEQILREAAVYESAWDKALFVHDTIILNCQYDMATYNNRDKDSLAFTAYGCLVNGLAVCDGYAKAYQLLLNRMGMECGYVYGTAANDLATGDHAWNYVNIDGAYYMVDVTWDDPVGYSGDCRRDYFCLSAAKMSEDHFIDADCTVPEMP